MTTQISQREELIALLNHAAELEHSLACSYLFAAFSLKEDADEGLPADAVEVVRGWKRTLGGVAIDEMMHLGVVNNLLTILGAAPHFERPNFPHDCAYYLPEYQIELQPFSFETLMQFIAIEQPDDGTLLPTIDASRIQEIEGDDENEIGPEHEDFDNQGDMYEAVIEGFKTLVDRLGEERVFVGPKPNAAQRQFLESSGWTAVDSLEDVGNALNHIITQGEGASHSAPDSHFTRFHAIFDEFVAFRERDPSFEPARPVLRNPFPRTPHDADGPVNLIRNEFAIQVSDLFSESYFAMLQLLSRFFTPTEETEAECLTLVDGSIEVMEHVLGPLASLLTRLPAGVADPRATAGPSFVTRTLHPLPYKKAAWALLHERFDELATYTHGLAKESGEARLQPVADALAKVASSLRQ